MAIIYGSIISFGRERWEVLTIPRPSFGGGYRTNASVWIVPGTTVAD